jgi:hypothetical protein
VSISNLRLTAAAGCLPPPLVDSPKCTKCSLAGICLPNEVAFLRRARSIRPLGRDTRVPPPAQPVNDRIEQSAPQIDRLEPILKAAIIVAHVELVERTRLLRAATSAPSATRL